MIATVQGCLSGTLAIHPALLENKRKINDTWCCLREGFVHPQLAESNGTAGQIALVELFREGFYSDGTTPGPRSRPSLSANVDAAIVMLSTVRFAFKHT